MEDEEFIKKSGFATKTSTGIGYYFVVSTKLIHYTWRCIWYGLEKIR